MAFKRKPLMTLTEKEVISETFKSKKLAAVPGVRDTRAAVAQARDLVREIAVLSAVEKKYGTIRQVAGHQLGDLILCEQFHEAGCSCGRPVFGPGGHKEWYFQFLSLPGVQENHDLRQETITK